jgi:hypothetical protein
MKRVNTRRIKQKYSYLIEELAKVCAVHPNTVHRWIKMGMPRIDDAYPYLVYGEQVIEFLKAQQAKNKITLALDAFYCFACQTSRGAWGKMADLTMTHHKIGNLKALCEHCDKPMNKRISLAKLPEIESSLSLHRTTLIQSPITSVNSKTKGVQNHDTI